MKFRSVLLELETISRIEGAPLRNQTPENPVVVGILRRTRVAMTWDQGKSREGSTKRQHMQNGIYGHRMKT